LKFSTTNGLSTSKAFHPPTTVLLSSFSLPVLQALLQANSPQLINDVEDALGDLGYLGTCLPESAVRFGHLAKPFNVFSLERNGSGRCTGAVRQDGCGVEVTFGAVAVWPSAPSAQEVDVSFPQGASAGEGAGQASEFTQELVEFLA
jgi:hypothetical protein